MEKLTYSITIEIPNKGIVKYVRTIEPEKDVKDDEFASGVFLSPPSISDGVLTNLRVEVENILLQNL